MPAPKNIWRGLASLRPSMLRLNCFSKLNNFNQASRRGLISRPRNSHFPGNLRSPPESHRQQPGAQNGDHSAEQQVILGEENLDPMLAGTHREGSHPSVGGDSGHDCFAHFRFPTLIPRFGQHQESALFCSTSNRMLFGVNRTKVTLAFSADSVDRRFAAIVAGCSTKAAL